MTNTVRAPYTDRLRADNPRRSNATFRVDPVIHRDFKAAVTLADDGYAVDHIEKFMEEFTKAMAGKSAPGTVEISVKYRSD